MSLTGKIMDFFADKDMTIPAFPRTKVKAVSNDEGIGLDAILDSKQDKSAITISDTEPENPKVGSVWIDTSEDDIALIDTVPTEGSNNLITSGGVFEGLNNRISITKLWENASPNSDFAAQNIAIDLTDYDGGIAIYRHYKGMYRETSVVCFKNNVYRMQAIGCTGDLGGKVQNGLREIKVTNSQIEVTKGIVSEAGGAFTDNNSVCVFIAFYGFKGVQ